MAICGIKYQKLCYIFRIILNVYMFVLIVNQLRMVVDLPKLPDPHVVDTGPFRFHKLKQCKGLRRQCFFVSFTLIEQFQGFSVCLPLILQTPMLLNRIDVMEVMVPLLIKFFYGQQLSLIQQLLNIFVDLGTGPAPGQCAGVALKPP